MKREGNYQVLIAANEGPACSSGDNINGRCHDYQLTQSKVFKRSIIKQIQAIEGVLGCFKRK